MDLPAILGAVTGTFVKQAGTKALQAYIQRRAEEAQQVLLKELAKADISAAKAASEDDAIAVIFRFERAVREGTARLNLRLMAKAMVGKIQVGTLIADEFLLYADALATLSRDEVIFIAELLKAHRARVADPTLPPAYENTAASPWSDAKLALTGTGWTEGRVTTAATRSQRSGFVMANSAWGGLIFEGTGMLLDLSKTVDFEDALRSEGIGF